MQRDKKQANRTVRVCVCGMCASFLWAVLLDDWLGVGSGAVTSASTIDDDRADGRYERCSLKRMQSTDQKSVHYTVVEFVYVCVGHKIKTTTTFKSAKARDHKMCHDQVHLSWTSLKIIQHVWVCEWVSESNSPTHTHAEMPKWWKLFLEFR